jgi:tetratricopeptide (TPR) repeat protein
MSPLNSKHKQCQSRLIGSQSFPQRQSTAEQDEATASGSIEQAEETVQEEVQTSPDWIADLQAEEEPEPDEIAAEGSLESEPQQSEETTTVEPAADLEETIFAKAEGTAEEDITRPVRVWGEPEEQKEEKFEVDSFEEQAVVDQLTAEIPEEAPFDQTAEADVSVPTETEPELASEVSIEQLSDDLPQTMREQAFSLLDSGQVEAAIDQYNQIVESGEMLDTVIEDLCKALDRYPVDVSIWQALGDAYLRNDQVQDALDSYTKAEELLQ